MAVTSTRGAARYANMFGPSASMFTPPNITPAATNTAAAATTASTPAQQALPQASFWEVLIGIAMLGALMVGVKLIFEHFAPAEDAPRPIRIGLLSSFTITGTVIITLTLLKMAFGVKPLNQLAPLRTIVLAA